MAKGETTGKKAGTAASKGLKIKSAGAKSKTAAGSASHSASKQGENEKIDQAALPIRIVDLRAAYP